MNFNNFIILIIFFVRKQNLFKAVNFEKRIYYNLLYVFYSQISENQHGYIGGRSAITNLLCFVNYDIII